MKMRKNVLDLTLKLNKINKRIKEFEGLCNTDLSSKFTGCAYITFEYYEDAQLIYKKLHGNILYRFLRRFLPDVAKRLYSNNIFDN